MGTKMYKQCNQLAIEWNLILLACCGKDQLHSNQMTPTDLTRQRNEFLLILKLNCWNLKIIIQWTNITFVSYACTAGLSASNYRHLNTHSLTHDDITSIALQSTFMQYQQKGVNCKQKNWL